MNCVFLEKPFGQRMSYSWERLKYIRFKFILQALPGVVVQVAKCHKCPAETRG